MPTAATKMVLPQRRRFTVDEYHQMAQAGILRPNDRVGLLDGPTTCECEDDLTIPTLEDVAPIPCESVLGA